LIFEIAISGSYSPLSHVALYDLVFGAAVAENFSAVILGVTGGFNVNPTGMIAIEQHEDFPGIHAG
jgi:hypothetical protein